MILLQRTSSAKELAVLYSSADVFLTQRLKITIQQLILKQNPAIRLLSRMTQVGVRRPFILLIVDV